MDLEQLRYMYLRRVVGGVLAAMPFTTAERLARSVARAIYAMNTPGRRVAEARLAPALDGVRVPERVSAVIASMYEHIARFWVEVLFAPRLLNRSTWRRRVRVSDEPTLQSLAGTDRGCIFATAYHGNPFIAAQALGRVFNPIHVVVDVAAHPYLRAWQKDMARCPWMRLVQRADAASELPRILANRGAVLMVCEQERLRGRGVAAEFLGERRRFYPTLGLLACRFDVPVCVATCTRGDEAFEFDLEVAGVIDPAKRENDPDRIFRETLAVLEAAILRRPEQYLWSLPGARKAPDGDGIVLSRRAATRRGIGSASSRRTRQTASGWQTPSAAGNTPAGRDSEAELVPRA